MELRLNLKICESCGCLWLRPYTEASVYCSPCHERLRQFPAVHGRKRPGPRPKTTIPTLHAVDARSPYNDLDPRRPSSSSAALLASAGGLQ
jgi:hypothetical protein